MIDDSIVREQPLVTSFSSWKKLGATEVRCLGSSTPAYPCFYGIDIQTRQELIAANHTVEETRQIHWAAATYSLLKVLIDSIGIETDA